MIDTLINNEKARKGRETIGTANNGPIVATAEAARKRITSDIDRAVASLSDALATIACGIVAFDGDRSAVALTIEKITEAIDALSLSHVPPEWAAPAVRIGARARLTESAPIRAMLPKADGLWTITGIAPDGKITLSDRIIVAPSDIVPVK